MERFEDIPGYEGIYQIGSLGSVKSLSRIVGTAHGGKRPQAENILKHNICNNYHSVFLFNGGKPKKMLVHRLVAFAFLYKSAQRDYVNHIDGNKHNNNVNNLEWCTSSENNTHAYKSGLKVPLPKVPNGRTNEKNASSKPVIQETIDGAFVRKWPSIQQIAREMGISTSNISNCAKGVFKQSYGFNWKYA